MVSGWKVRRISNSYAFYLQRQQIQDMYAILKLSICKLDAPKELVRSIYSQLPGLKAKYIEEMDYYYKTGSWIQLKLKSKKSPKNTPEPRLLDNRDSEEVDLNDTGNLSIKLDSELADISSQNILETVNKTLSFEPEIYSPHQDDCKTTFNSEEILSKQSIIRKKPEGLRLNLDEIMRNQYETVKIDKPLTINQEPVKKSLQQISNKKNLPRHAYITLPLISSESEESVRNDKSTMQELDKKLYLESSFSIANLSSIASEPNIPYLTYKSTAKTPMSILHTQSFKPKQDSKVLKIKTQPKQKVTKIDIRKLSNRPELYTPSITSIKPFDYLTVSALEIIFKEMASNHVTIEEYFLQSSRVVSKSSIPQYRLNSKYLNDRF